MNIFILSLDPKECAEQHCDKHVIKMILETTQLLYMCWEHYGGENWRQNLEIKLKTNESLKILGDKANLKTYKYGKGHMKHPCSLWLRESQENYKWLCNLGLELCKEKKIRWEKNAEHSCKGHLEVLKENMPDGMPDIKRTRFKLAMPDEYKSECPIKSYRKYYVEDKRKLFKWTKRKQPEWTN